jgi:citrate synthase
MRDKPVKGLADVVAASSALSDIDGAAGRLFYRGYDIHDLAGRISFEECVHLLVRGALPTQEQLAGLTAELDAARGVPPTAESIVDEVSAKGSPMEALRTLLSAASADDPDKDSNAPDARRSVSSRSPPCWWRATTTPAAAASCRTPTPPSARRATSSCRSPASAPRRRRRPRSTTAWCCTRTTR